MAASPSQGSMTGIAPAPGYGWNLLEVAALCLVLAAPLYWAGPRDLHIFLPLGLVIAYVVAAPVAALLTRPADLPPRRRIAAFVPVQLVAGCAIAAGLSLPVFAVWFHAAYRPEIVDPYGLGPDFALAPATMLPLALGLMGGGMALLLAAMPLLRRHGESIGACFRRLRESGTRLLWPAAAASLVLGLGIVSLLGIVSSTTSLLALLQSANPTRTVDVWFLAGEFPGLAAAILAAAVLMVAFRRLQPAALASLRRNGPAARTRPTGFAAVLVAIAAGYGWALYMMHLGIIAAFGPVAMIVSWGEVSRAADNWIALQEAAGRAPAEIAAAIRGHLGGMGAGPAAEPGGVFAELVGSLEDLGLSAQCSVTIDAGIADSSALRNQPWIAGYESGFRPLPPVGYCLRLACPSAAVWQERPVVVLHSSHPSRNRGWAYNVFMDIFGAGRAPESGGYCTADGRLAARYQG